MSLVLKFGGTSISKYGFDLIINDYKEVTYHLIQK